MGRTSKIKVGDWYGMWQVVETDIEQHGTNRKVLCKCGDCGMTRLVFTTNLLSGKSSNCRYCARRHLRPTHPGHPHVLNAGVVIGTLTILRVVPIEEWRSLAHKIERPNYRRTVEARCLCGNTIIRRVDVIKRDGFVTCHHCRENATLYRHNSERSAGEQLSDSMMNEYAKSQNCRWFDMDTKPPTEHRTDEYRAWLKLNNIKYEGDNSCRMK